MSVVELYQEYIVEKTDPRVKDWFLLSSLWPVTVILAVYLYIVMIGGKRFMENRKAYNLKTFIFYYNIFQILSNTLLVYFIIISGWTTELTLGCEPLRYSWEKLPLRLASMCWWTMLLKIIDLMETVMFILRKKYNQISFLHVYHHTSTVFFAWFVAKYFPGGMCTFAIMINSSVHVLMYSYYLLSNLGPKAVEISQIVKPYITIIQMVQLTGLILYGCQALSPSCDVPKIPAIFLIVNLMINLYQFYKFYNKSYTKSKKVQ